jgi:hypothetical protein
MKNITIILFHILFFMSNLNAQVAYEIFEIFSVNHDFFINQSLKNSLSLNRVQDRNHIVTFQEQQKISTNILGVFQEGSQNSIYIDQSGSFLETRFLQYKSNNEANLWSVGEKIKVAVKQDGDGNKINSYIENSRNVFRSASLLQEGNFNKIELSLIGDGFTDHTIEQTIIINQYGNQHEVKAFMEPFYNPLEITQTPGTNGEGMKIDVSTSTFSFPTK